MNKTQDVLFQYNVQHDCALAGCTDSGTSQVIQERVESGISENFIVHTGATERYLINVHGQHNPHLIREALPRELTIPVPFALDRVAYHLKISTDYRTSQDSKRVAAATKATLKKNAVVTSDSQPGPSRKRKRVEGPASTQTEVPSADLMMEL